MKTSSVIFVQICIVSMIFMFSQNAFSQRVNTWKGGAPGMENEWNCAKNWSGFFVPDEFTDVVVPESNSTTLSSPIIQSGQVMVNALRVAPEAILTLEQGATLTVISFATGIDKNNIIGDGQLLILDELNDKETMIALSHRQY